jgi:hypothetical protein
MKSNVMMLSIVFFVLSCSKNSSPTQVQVPTEGENGITANYKYGAVEHLALSSDSTLKLMSIGTDAMNVDGTSKSWWFIYTRTILPYNGYYFTATFDSIRFDSISTRMGVGSSIITQAWVNSCVAAQIAESDGGKAFRSSNPDCSIYASVGEAVVPNPIVSWYIMYRSNIDRSIYKTFNIDARIATTNK